MLIEITLPWPPSLNRYYRSVNGRVLIAAEGRRYRGSVARHVAVQCIGIDTLDKRLAVQIALSPPDRRRRDIDNTLKALLDACTHAGLWRDDELIDDLHIVRGPVRQNGGAVALRVKEA